MVCDSVQEEGTGRNLSENGGVMGEEEASGGLLHESTAGCWHWGSESGCSGALGSVLQSGLKLGNSRILGLAFDLGWMF